VWSRIAGLPTIHPSSPLKEMELKLQRHGYEARSQPPEQSSVHVPVWDKLDDTTCSPRCAHSLPVVEPLITCCLNRAWCPCLATIKSLQQCLPGAQQETCACVLADMVSQFKRPGI
jgi:hypothetical protein